MSIELAFSGANLLTLIGYLIFTERRLTRLETLIFQDRKECKHD
jgi:hypothetical protein